MRIGPLPLSAGRWSHCRPRQGLKSLHANCYITKPVDLDQFTKVVRSIEDFWLAIVKLPNGDV